MSPQAKNVPPVPPLPPVLRNIFPQTAQTMKNFTPAQATMFFEKLVAFMNASERLPFRCKLIKKSAYKMTIEIDIQKPTLPTATKES